MGIPAQALLLHTRSALWRTPLDSGHSFEQLDPAELLCQAPAVVEDLEARAQVEV